MLYVSGQAVVQKAGSVKYITDTPKNLYKCGKFRTVPMMTGVTKHDGSFITTCMKYPNYCYFENLLKFYFLFNKPVYVAAVYDVLEALNLLNNDDFMRNNLTKYLLDFSGFNLLFFQINSNKTYQSNFFL